jgi:hypothetical protein
LQLVALPITALPITTLLAIWVGVGFYFPLVVVLKEAIPIFLG